MEITLVVPYDFAPLAMCLYQVFGIPLSVDIQKWAPYAEMVEMDG